MHSVKHRIADQIRNALSKFMPVHNSISKFHTDGLLTPKEFVESGDYLILQFPSWFWRGASEGYSVNWLPPDKQYLHIDNIPCRRRLNSSQLNLISSTVNIKTDEKNEEWILSTNQSKNSTDCIARIDEIRYYDVSITYDKYFQTPRVWLFGYDKNGFPLTTEEVVQDIISDYASKTITIDPHPSNGILCVSIHPCNHSNILKKMAKNYPAHLSIVILLKFITTVIPSIEIDNTIDIDIKFDN